MLRRVMIDNRNDKFGPPQKHLPPGSLASSDEDQPRARSANTMLLRDFLFTCSQESAAVEVLPPCQWRCVTLSSKKSKPSFRRHSGKSKYDAATKFLSIDPVLYSYSNSRFVYILCIADFTAPKCFTSTHQCLVSFLLFGSEQLPHTVS